MYKMLRKQFFHLGDAIQTKGNKHLKSFLCFISFHCFFFVVVILVLVSDVSRVLNRSPQIEVKDSSTEI